MASYVKTSLERAYAETFLADLESNTNQYFLFIGRGATWGDGSSDNSPPAYTDTVASEYEVMNQIIGYKKLNPENVIFALYRNLWISGTKYDQYDDAVDLSTKKYYVVTDDNHIYKCLSNGGGAASTMKPSLLITTPFTLSDGYKWKYMATVKESNLPYELTDYVPVEFIPSDLDTETQNQYNTQITATDGSIDRMVLSYPAGTPAASFGVYPNSRTVVNTQRPKPIVVATITKLNSTQKRVTVTDSVSIASLLANSTSIANYTNYIVRVVETAPQYTTEKNNYGVIVSATQNAQNEIELVVENDVVDFNFTPSNVHGIPVGVEILPYVKIVGNGSGCYAFPVMDSSNRITSVDVINGGNGYSSTLVEVVSSKTASTVHPTLTSVISPKGGHGSNILRELGVKDVLVIVPITEEDSQTIMGGGKYRQFGIIKNPVLSDETFAIAGKQEQSYSDIELLPTIGSVDPSHFDLSEYNFIIGSESFASSRIVSVKSIANDRVVLKTLNTTTNFISRLDRPNDYLIGIEKLEFESDKIQSFQIGEIVTQTVPANTPFGTAQLSFGFDFVATGRIVAKTTDSIAVRVTSAGNFIASSSYPVVGNTSQTSGIAVSVSPRYGEEVWVTNQNDDGLAAFVQNNSANQKLYKISSVNQGYFDLNRVPSYSGLHVLHLRSSLSGVCGGMDTTSAPLSQTSFSNGDRVHQGITGQFGHYATGTVYHWNYINPASGELYLTNVYGSFKSVAKDGLTGSQLRAFVVSDVTLPEISPTSGEVIYINNIRPIDRTVGQEEEFRIRLGF